MLDLSQLISTFFYIVLLILCIFIFVHASLQIKNSTYTLRREKTTKDNKKKNDNNKMAKILVISIVLGGVILFKILNNVSSFKADIGTVYTYKYAVEDLNSSLSLELKAHKYGEFETAEDIAIFINRQLPIKSMYYVGSDFNNMNKFSKYEIMKYKLSDFEYKPTVVSYEGMLMSVVKFAEGCSYVNKRNIAKSDCIIEVDVNHYAEPNQIGQDRTLFAIDGINKKVIADPNFFKK